MVLLALLCGCIASAAQTASRQVSPGPRAVGLLQFDDKGKVHLVPVVIMFNGEFYDASAYKATPVPMALEPETVYEGIRSGESQGLFTIARARQVMGIWTAEGKWAPGGPEPEAKPRAALAPKEEEEGPPVLRRGAPKQVAPAEKPAPAPAPDEKPPAKVGGPSQPVEPEERPVLKHGRPESQMQADEMTDSRGTAMWTTVTTIPAVSDAKVIEPRSYHYLLKGDEEQELRTKMLALAAQQLNGTTAKPAKAKTAAAKPPQLQDVKFEAYDPSSNNEPVFVLSASLPAKTATGKDARRYLVLVARQDIYSEMHVAFYKISEPQHLDSQPRFELIDVVDADGDGYGEMLFRRTTDSGHAYSVYRVIGNQLWPIFEGAPQ